MLTCTNFSSFYTAVFGETRFASVFGLFQVLENVFTGSYRVTLSKFDPVADDTADVDGDDYVPPGASKPDKLPANQLPKNLADPATSGLTATVDPNATENVFDFSVGG